MNHTIPRLFVSTATVLVLSACATVPSVSTVRSVKEINADQAAYLARNFDIKLVNPEVLKKIPAETNQLTTFKSLTVKLDGLSVDADGKKTMRTLSETYSPAVNGLTQIRIEALNNDIPLNVQNTLSYKGLVAVRTQDFATSSAVSSSLYEVKELSVIEPLPTQAGQKSTMRYKFGRTEQTANFVEFQRVCTAQNSTAANRLHANLTGEAINLTCEFSSNGMVTARNKWVYLPQYSVAYAVESSTGNAKWTFTLKDVQVTL